jgi:hypothetical protein
MDGDLTPRLKCDIELELVGPTPGVLDKWTADVLRALADRLEKGEFQVGFSSVTDKVGKPVGKIYIDYSEGDDG